MALQSRTPTAASDCFATWPSDTIATMVEHAEKSPLWKRIVYGPGKWLLGVLAGGIAGYITKSIEDGSIAAAWAWCWSPSSAPNAIALVASIVVLSCTAFAIWRWFAAMRERGRPLETQAVERSVWLEFRGGIYFDRLWEWHQLMPPGDAHPVTPLCATDGAALGLATLPKDRHNAICPDCGRSEVMERALIGRVGALIRRDISTGEWIERQRRFVEARRKLAAASSNVTSLAAGQQVGDAAS